jgi:hypothetical protein
MPGPHDTPSVAYTRGVIFSLDAEQRLAVDLVADPVPRPLTAG